MARYIGLVAFYTALAAIIVYGNRAHAEPFYGPVQRCELWAAGEVGIAYDRLESGVSPALVRHLVRSDPAIGGAGRWLLVEFIDAWEIAKALDRHMSRDEAIHDSALLCHVEPGEVARVPYPRFTRPITRRFDMHIRTRDPLPKFVQAAIDNPEGFRPGRYFYVMYLPEFRKVSRYLRSPAIVQRKIKRYEKKYAEGDRNWPEVDRLDELRDSLDVRLTMVERVASWLFPAATNPLWPHWSV